MNKRTLAIVRATGVIGATVAIVVGATFASLSSTVSLTNSSINSATADLQIWDGASFGSSAPGYNVTNLVPGTPQSFPIYFKNNGGVPLNLTAAVPALPTLTNISDASKVKITIASDRTGCTDPPLQTTVQALWSAPQTLPCNPLSVGAQGNSGVAGTEGNYTISYDIDPSGVTGSSASVGSFNIDFTGTQ